jgi:2-C-methyl-D-erythritol 2,4-cyclodiphosphate synthase
MPAPPPPFRIGHGYDLHRLEPIAPAGPGRPFILGTIVLDHPMGPVAHSDGDALLHAITDALLGALSLPDIGQQFPETDPKWQSADSRLFLTAAAQLVRERGYEIGNIDCTIILERPKLRPVKDAMRARLAALLAIDLDRINIKGKTHESLDAIGEGRGVEVHVVALLVRAGAGA